MAGFTSPNYTQVPNDLFEIYMAEMGEAELKVTLAIIRQTLGYHREKVKFSIAKLEAMTGLSRNGVKSGAEAAEQKGLLERLNPDNPGSAEWGLSVTPSASDPPQPVTPTPSASDPQLGLNKDKEREKEDEERKLAERTKILAKLYSENIGVITPLQADLLKDTAKDYPIASWYAEAFKIAVANNARRWNYIQAILDGWKRNGYGWKPNGKGYKSNGKNRQNNQAPEPDNYIEELEKKRARVKASIQK